MSPHMTATAPAPAAGLVAVDGRRYPLRDVRITAQAHGGFATTRLTQVFENPYDEALEVVYTLPLPADGAVLAYTIRVGDRVIRGEVEPREKAEEMYRRALYEGRTAGLLEQERADTFRQRLGNLPPRTSAEVEVLVLHPLGFLPVTDRASARWEYRFPTVTSVRYHGAPGRVPDADRVDAERDAAGAIPTRAQFTLEIHEPAGGTADALSPSHLVEVAAEPSATTVRFRGGERLDRDVVVRWAACTRATGMTLVEGAGLPGDDGRYGLLTIVPPAVPAKAFARDLTVLIDASGSMSGRPLELARRVAAGVIDGLDPGDRFDIIAFANQPVSLTRRMTDVTPASLAAAHASLAKLQASGGTEMLDAVVEATRSLREETQRQVVLITDGMIGFEAEVAEHLVNRLPAGSRVHAVGIGSAPNRTLLRGVARAGRGTEWFAGDEAGADEAARQLRAATARPVLDELTVRGGAVKRVAPGRLGDVFAGRPLVATIELDPAGGLLEVEGRLPGTHEPWVRRFEVPATMPAVLSPIPVGALHGRELVTDLELGLTRFQDQRAPELIEAAGMRHRIASSRTSLVAIADEPSVDPKQPRRRERLAVELPAEVSAEGLFGGQVRAASTAVMKLRSSLVGGIPASPPTSGFELSLEGPGLASVLRSARGEGTTVGRDEHIEITDVEVVHRDDTTLVLDLAVPVDGFELPTGQVEVEEVAGRCFRATVDTSAGSPAGAFPRGVRVTLVLRVERVRGSWKSDRILLVRWGGRIAGENAGSVALLVPPPAPGTHP